MTLRRRKSRKSQAVDVLGSYLKVKAAGKAAKGAKKAAKGTAAYQVAKRAPRPRKLPLIAAGAAAAILVAIKATRRSGGSEPATA
jgi:hypothetical protein